MTTICRSNDLTVPPLVGCCLWNIIVSNIGRWSDFSAWIVFQVVLLYSEDDIVVMSGDVGC